jgi:hypothetical protein
MAVVASLCHQRGIRLHRYLDDWLLVASSSEEAQSNTQWVLTLADQLGLLVNLKKLDLTPSQEQVYLGMRINTQIVRVFPADKRIDRLVELVQLFRESDFQPAWEWLRLIGHLVSLEKLVPMGRMHLRSLQLRLKEFWSQDQDARKTMIPLSTEIVLDLIWWLDPDNILAGAPFQKPLPDLHLYTDASTQGWGAHLLHLQASGLWSPQEKRCHINLLELEAVRLGLQSFREFCQGKTVLVMSDNSTVVAHIKNQGGTRSRALCLKTLDLLKWSLENQIDLQSCYNPGQKNVLADQLSRRNQVLPAEWSLLPDVCRQIWKVWDTPNIDLFATKRNYKLPVYCSPVPDPQAWFTDCMVMSWNNLWSYAFPPPALVGKVLSKLMSSSNSRMILIAPLWSQQPWFPELLALLVDLPREIPPLWNLLKQPHLEKFHPTPEIFRYHAWRLSSVDSEIKDFRSRLPLECPDPTESQRLTSIRASGPNSVIGVVNRRRIHSKPLFS